MSKLSADQETEVTLVDVCGVIVVIALIVVFLLAVGGLGRMSGKQDENTRWQNKLTQEDKTHHWVIDPETGEKSLEVK